MRNLTLYGLMPVAFVFALGCEPEYGVVQSDSELEISPSLTDLGTVPVGDTELFDLQLDHVNGAVEIKIRNVSVTNIEGEFFVYDGTVDGIILGRGDTLKLPFFYAPTEEGYHRATVEITHDGEDSPAIVDVRGQGILPDATLWPLGLDFGPVDVGNNSTRDLTIKNQSDLDLTVSEAVTSNAVFAVIDAVPFTVSGGNELVLRLAFTPTDINPANGSLTLRAGSVELPQVGLRGNDCENGDPTAYDQDGDGYTTCGGDCDDANVDVKPGALESANGTDDDCDGIVDEGTVWYDDDGDGYCDDDVYCSDGTLPGDCSDSADLSAGTAFVNPGVNEILDNGIDDDCDGVVDLGTTDGDGDGYSVDGGDCDDGDPMAYPGAPEHADFIDNNCNVIIDETTTFYDDDGDGYCDDIAQCSDGSLPGDCDDDVADANGDLVPDGRPTNPGAVEQYDWRDNNCEGTVDEGTIGFDDDGDGYTEVGGDCNDDDTLDAFGVPLGAAFSPALGNCP